MDTPTPPVIDCDVHAVVPSVHALTAFLPAYWREQILQTGFKGPTDSWYPQGLAQALGHQCADAGKTAAEVFGSPPHPAFAVLTCDYAVETLHNPDASAAMAQAVNEWIAAEWLARDARFRASIIVASAFPELAVREIERAAKDPRFVQVLLPVRSESPYGSRNFRPVFAAAERLGLPVALHYGGAPGNPPTPVGWPSLVIEEVAGATGVFQTQLLSIIAGGVFDEYPGLRLVLAESGFAWLPPMLWRFDKNWKGLRREIPWVRKPPSEYARTHVRLTTAPFDAPKDPEQFAAAVAQLGSDDMLLYASDYPHRHGDERCWELLPDRLRQRIASDNPRGLYRL